MIHLQNLFTFYTDPLEQFDIVFHTYILNFNFGLTMILHCIILILIFFFLEYTYSLFNNISLVFLELALFVSTTLKRNLGLKSYPYFFFFFFNFIYILLANLAGMVAYSTTVTSSLILTFFFSYSYFFGVNIYGILLNKSQYLALFVPNGVPLVILPALYLIEIISYFSRVISLAVRLFANMLSGHALLKILLSFVLTFLLLKSQWFIAFILPWVITILVSLLEYVIAFLQSYVYLVLVIIYLNDVINLH